MNREIIYEIACFGYDSALKAADAGAHRIELCSNQSEGGVTPSLGLIEKVRKDFNTSLHVIIRPRGGDFNYLSSEFDIMKRDIGICKDAAVDGVVFGILTDKGEIDIKRNKQLVELAKPMTSTFHRAFDSVSNPVDMLNDVIECGFARLLTSGGKENAVKGLEIINGLIEKADGRIIIMPGGGIRRDNINILLTQTRATEFHSSSPSIIGNHTVSSNFCTKL